MIKLNWVIVTVFAVLLNGCTVYTPLTRLDGTLAPDPDTGSDYPYPATDQEAAQYCRVASQIAYSKSYLLCMDNTRVRMSIHNNVCVDRLPQGRSEATYRQCMHNGRNFDKLISLHQEYVDFRNAKTEEQFRSFIETYSVEDQLRLVPDARHHLAKFCGDGIRLDASDQEARAWIARFVLVGTNYCIAQRQTALRVLRRNAFQNAQGNEAALTKLLDEYPGDDPDGILDKARSQIALLHEYEERKYFESIESWVNAERFIDRYESDSRSKLISQAKSLRDEKKTAELERLRGIPLLDLRRELAKGRTAMPSVWIAELDNLIRARAPLEERALLENMDADGLRAFLKGHSSDSSDPESQASTEGLTAAEDNLHRLLLALVFNGTDVQRESLLNDEYATSEIRSLATEKLTKDYLARRDFSSIHKLYTLTHDVSLLQRGQGFAKTTTERLLLESAAVAVAKSPSRLFTIDVAFDSAPVESNAQDNMGYFANFTATVKQPLRGTLVIKPSTSSPLNLRYGSYLVYVNVSWRSERMITRRSAILGNKDERDTPTGSRTIAVRLEPPNYQARETFDLGTHEFGYFQSGSMGGFTAIQLASDPLAIVEITSIVPIERVE